MNYILSLYLQRINRMLIPVALIIGFFMIAKAGYILMTSEGDPQKVTQGREDLTSAIMGLLFVITIM